MDVLGVLRALAGIVLLAYLPGHFWARVLLPWLATRLERFVFSVILSIAMMVVTLYWGNVVLRIPVTAQNAVIASLGWTLLGVVLLAWRSPVIRARVAARRS